MKSSSPLRHAAHTVPIAALSLLLLTAGMCGRADDSPPPGNAERAAADFAAPAPDETPVPLESPSPAEVEEQHRLEAIATAERELAEREARLAAEEERLRQERELQAERDRLATERAAAAERERRLADRERQLREQQAEQELAVREAERAQAAEKAASAESPAPEPLPEPTGSYEGNFDEPWRESGGPEVGSATPTVEEHEPPAVTRASVQAGERLEVQLVDTVSSETARAGDTFSSRLVDDLRDQFGAVVIPAGAEVRGRVTEAIPYRRRGEPARLAVEFTHILVSPEQTVGIRASFVELGADKGKNRKKVIAGAVVGAILGHILGGDGSKSVIIGAAAGAAAGGAVVARANDRDAEIPAGQVITLELQEVVTVEIEYGAVAPD